MLKKYNNKAIILPLAILLMLLAGTLIYNVGSLLIDRTQINSNEYLSNIALREAENALIFGVYASNTSISNGGMKAECNNSNKIRGWDYSTGKTQINDLDKGINETKEGYTIKRFINYQQLGYASVSDNKATLVGIAEIYKENKKIAEKAVAMDINLGYNGTENGTNACSATVVQMHKETWRIIK